MKCEKSKKFGLENRIIQQINNVFAQHPQLEKVILYGSRAKGNHKKGSDLDLALHGKGMTLSLQHQIEIELDDLLLPYTFDISIFNQISNPDLIDHINRVGIVFYNRIECFIR